MSIILISQPCKIVIFISQEIFICENSSNKDFSPSYLYNEIGRNKTSHELRETFLGEIFTGH